MSGKAETRFLGGTAVGFLSRLENFYLNVLRVFVLVAATLALIVVGLGAVRSVPMMSAALGSKQPAIEAPGATLGDFVAERNTQGNPVSGDGQAQAPSTPVAAPRSISNAVAQLQSYAKNRVGVEVRTDKLTAFLVDKREGFPTTFQDRYGDSINALANQLSKSRGRPLSWDNVVALLEWHAEKFKAQVEEIESRNVVDRVQGLQSLVVAGGALAIFLLIVFCFLVVKIERNLRLVRTVAVDASSGAAAAPQGG